VRKTLFFFMLFIIAGNIFSQEIPPWVKYNMSIRDIKNALKVEKRSDNTEVGYGFTRNFREGREEWKNQGEGKFFNLKNEYIFSPNDKNEPEYSFHFNGLSRQFRIMYSGNTSKNEIINKFNRKYGQFTREEGNIVWRSNMPQNIDEIALIDTNNIMIIYFLKDTSLVLIPYKNFNIGETDISNVVKREDVTFLSPKNGTRFTATEVRNVLENFFNQINLSETDRIALVLTVSDFLNAKKPEVIVIRIQPDEGESVQIVIGRADMNK
jgi:hypothetical protein